ncbi:MAG: hypothetical protein A4S08_05800 [Proteobacteria bacterium SG_bin4]|nr:MAG: hypothetical protein A4S08_05800 [Proteobacteria bacterium SG_bin4]
MKTQPSSKLIREGNYVIEVQVDLQVTPEGWSPYLSLEEAYKLDDARAAIRRGDLVAAARFGRVFTLVPVAV